MRKVISVLALFTLLALPALVFAQDIPTEPTGCIIRGDYSGFEGLNCPDPDDECLFDSDEYDCGACCVLDAVYKISRWIFYIVIIIGFIFLIMGAFNIMTAGGVPEKVQTGRNYILYAIIGIIVALVSLSLPRITMAILGIGAV